MTRHTRHKKSPRLFQDISYLGSYNVHTSVELIRYDKQHVSVKAVQPEQVLAKEIHEDSVSWFKIIGFSDVESIKKICKTFGIQRFDIKDLFSNISITKVVAYQKVVFIMMSCCNFEKDERMHVSQVAFIVGHNFIISLQEASSPIFDEVEEAIKESVAQIRDKDADYLLYVLLNSVHSVHIDAITRISEKTDEIEDRLIALDSDRNIMNLIRCNRADTVLIRRSIIPLREEFKNLLRNSNKVIKDDNILYFEDFDDRMRTTVEELEIVNETIDSVMGLYFNNNNLRMNDIIKRLTIVSTIFIPLTFMVGVWGMNFKFMPELDWEYGYIVSWIILACIAGISVYFLKKKKWF